MILPVPEVGSEMRNLGDRLFGFPGVERRTGRECREAGDRCQSLGVGQCSEICSGQQAWRACSRSALSSLLYRTEPSCAGVSGYLPLCTLAGGLRQGQGSLLLWRGKGTLVNSGAGTIFIEADLFTKNRFSCNNSVG